MVERLKSYIESLQLFGPTDTLLVGVSGGKDSVVLLDLLHRAGYAFSMAHCNFNLRGEESDQDEELVRALAKKYDKPLYCRSFETLKHAELKGISVEMAARELRYAWFEETRKKNHFDWIVVAHHMDDQIETFFLNLSRGTGLSGLTGIKPVNGKVVRPLLFATVREIEEYAAAVNLEYREDSTNALTDFQRNKIRHLVIPLMEELNPSFRLGMQETIHHLRDANAIFKQAVGHAAERAVTHRKAGVIEISISELKMLRPMETYLFEFLKPFLFNGDVVDDLSKSLDGQPGKQFFSSTHRALVDRDTVIVRKLPVATPGRFYLEDQNTVVDFPVKLSFTNKARNEVTSLTTPPGTALVDKDLLQFPLIVRKWQTGDFFQPLGMKGMKKLSDFFVDEKFTLADKEDAWLLTNGEEIVWLIGIRLDDRYKISPSTRNVLEIRVI